MNRIVLSERELIKYIDELNKNDLEYIGIWHEISGDRVLVEASEKFINNLHMKPIIIFEIKNPISKNMQKILRNSIVLEIESPRVNIYKLDHIKEKLKERGINNLTKKKCILKLE